MAKQGDITSAEVESLYQQLAAEAAAGGYHLNPDQELTRHLLRGLLVNEKRYGYRSCPCRLAAGKREDDLDIICPCDYRDADITEYGACYCGLYVSQDVVAGRRKVSSIPERRPSPEERGQKKPRPVITTGAFPLPVWRCRVCGYLCARDAPPEVCPICRAKKERFERFI